MPREEILKSFGLNATGDCTRIRFEEHSVQFYGIGLPIPIFDPQSLSEILHNNDATRVAYVQKVIDKMTSEEIIELGRRCVLYAKTNSDLSIKWLTAIDKALNGFPCRNEKNKFDLLPLLKEAIKLAEAGKRLRTQIKATSV